MSAYSIMLCVGVVAMCVITVMRRKKYGMSAWKAILFSLTLTVIGVLGCKLLYIAENFDDFQANGLTFGGFSFFGAVFLIPICFWFLGKPFGLRSWQAVDCCAPGVAIMISLMRIGCFIDGCCGAYPIEMFDRQIVLPVQLFEAAFDFTLLMVLWYLEDTKKAQGYLYPTFMIAYGVMRFGIEFLRDTPKDWLYLSHGQWFSMIAVVIALIYVLSKKQNKKGGKVIDKTVFDKK